MMCAIMNRFRRINASARQRLVFDLRIPFLWNPESLPISAATPAGERDVCNSALRQPLFIRCKRAYAKTSTAPERQIFAQTKRYQIFVRFALLRWNPCEKY